MAKGGRYLNTNKKTGPEGGKKKGKGWKIFFTILIVLVLLIGIVVFIAWRYVGGLLGKVNRAEVIHQDVSVEDIQYWATYNPDAETLEDGGSEDFEEETQPEEPQEDTDPSETTPGESRETDGPGEAEPAA